jgi:hypothetical protein
MYYFLCFQICCKSKNRSPRWEHLQTQTDARTKYIRGAMQTDVRDHFWAFEMRRPAGDALNISSSVQTVRQWAQVLIARMLREVSLSHIRPARRSPRPSTRSRKAMPHCRFSVSARRVITLEQSDTRCRLILHVYTASVNQHCRDTTSQD